MKVVYVAGPFRSTNADGSQSFWGIHNNVMRAMSLALEVWKRGAVAICPHGNTFCFQNAEGTKDDVWLNGDLELVLRSDAVLVTPDWEKSSGARGEVAYATAHRIPILYSIQDLDRFLYGVELIGAER